MVSLVIAYLLNLLDYAITAYWVNLYGTEIEGNPLMRWCFENHCAWEVKIFAVGVPFGVIGYFIHKYPRTAWAGKILLVAYALLMMYHLVLLIITFG